MIIPLPQSKNEIAKRNKKMTCTWEKEGKESGQKMCKKVKS